MHIIVFKCLFNKYNVNVLESCVFRNKCILSAFCKCNINVLELKCISKCIKIYILISFKCTLTECNVNA